MIKTVEYFWSWMIILLVASAAWAQDKYSAPFAGQDLHMTADIMYIQKTGTSPAEHILVFENGFSMWIGGNELASDKAVVWLTEVTSQHLGQRHTDYQALVYLEGKINAKQGLLSKSAGINSSILERGDVLVCRFLVNGEIYATADTRKNAEASEIQSLVIFQKAEAAVSPVEHEPNIRKEAEVPEFPLEQHVPFEPVEAKKPWQITEIFKPRYSEETGREPVIETPAKKKFEYPVNFVTLWQPVPQVDSNPTSEGKRVTTIIGRFYCWQQQDEDGNLVEFQADTAVVFHRDEKFDSEGDQSSGLLASGDVQAVYFKGNIVMTEGQRTIRADEIYYDFVDNQALAVNAEMRDFDEKRALPVYLRAMELRQVSKTIFEAEKLTLTTSEFYLPQISMNASRMVLTNTTNIDARSKQGTDKESYEGVLYDVDFRYGSTTLLSFDKVKTNFERPDVPIKRATVGSDSDMGTSVETQWYLARILGLQEPEGVESTMALDYFSDRGVGAGAEVEYEKNNSYGDIIAYVMSDRGNDDLGRTSDRKDIDPGEDVRGRFRFRHRQYLPHDWQATVETSYLSDENFLEWMYRSEFNVGKSQETLLHLKRITDNWGFSLLNKVRINDFETMTEELPTAEFHLKGQSLWDHRLTYYSDTTVSRLRDRVGDTSSAVRDSDFYTFASTRHEIDMPFMWDTIKLVPFAATTYGFEDQNGFVTDIDGRMSSPGEDSVYLHEGGIRASTMFWKADQFVKSRFWDLNGIRHIIRPHVEAVTYDSSESVVNMRDMVNIGLSQRWQTRRGPKDKLRSLNWMRLNMDVTWVSDNAEPSVGPGKFMFNDPSIPLSMRKNIYEYGIMRDSFNADYMWRLSDTTTILGDMSYDFRSGHLQQADVGVARYVYPDLSYYLGSRYLRPVVVEVASDGIYEQGSHSFVTAVTYRLNPKYSATLSNEYNFDYGKSVKSDLTFLRHYHRLYYGLTFSIDESRDRRSFLFSVWPEGVKELALGSRKYVGITGPMIED